VSYQLPDRRLLVHKAIDLDKLSSRNAPIIDPETGLPCRQHYSWEKKYDGCSVIVVVDLAGEVTFWSRDGKPCTSLGHLAGNFARLRPGTVLFGEAWAYGKEFREISGAFRRKAVQEHLHVKVFDTVSLHEFEQGRSDLPYRVRRDDALHCVHRCGHSRITLANDCMPWEVGELASHPSDAYDGAVAKRWDGLWIAGAGTGGEVLKIKNVVDVDLEVIRVEEGEGKHAGRLGAIVCRYDNGIELRVGTGFSDLQRRAWWLDKYDIIGRIVRVVGMKDSGKGSLREPRFKGVRHDKDTPDF